ncbi:hypothetical protein TSUD_316670 [Trifolium subterraneum]|uniref:Uncharacterized protein n=1 Tax=Trifolium subterraneum TaxID=3900 RepID=A0A2Z6MUG0_TRISU|nr:hypothetical protein TSUD_316670 [Trifolium subterraneum]
MRQPMICATNRVVTNWLYIPPPLSTSLTCKTILTSKCLQSSTNPSSHTKILRRHCHPPPPTPHISVTDISFPKDS